MDWLSFTHDEYELFFSNSLEMFCISSYDGYFKKVNPAFEEVLGYSAEEFCSNSYLSFIHPDDIEKTILEVEKQLGAGEKVLNFENRYRHKNGNYRLLSWKSSPKGNYMCAVARDITEARKNELEILQQKEMTEAAVKELENFAHMVAHDLRAPLRSIQSFSAILLEDHAAHLNPEGQKQLDRVITASKRMTQLIEGLLNLSYINREIVTKKDVDITQMVEEICEQLRAQDPQRNVRLHVQKSLVAKVSPELFRSALLNLLGNAWKFTKNNNEAVIEFGQLEIEDTKKFFVRDNGVGFNKKYSNKLFGVFQRLHSVSEFEGIGIGLATTRRIIERHGGMIQADLSTDQGATFYFTV